MSDNAQRCDCGHRALAHRYLFGSRANDGDCMASGCRCEGYKEEE